MSIVALLSKTSNRVRSGGGTLYLVEYDATKNPYLPHATLKNGEAIGATALDVYDAPDSAVPYVETQWGTSGTLDIDIFAHDAAAEQKAYSGLAADVFTASALTTARTAGAVVKKQAATDYTLTDWKNVGHLGGTELTDKQDSTDEYDELGALVGATSGNRLTEVKTVLKQTGKIELDFLQQEAPTKEFALKYVVPLASGGNQFVIVRRCKIVLDLATKFENQSYRSLPITIKVLADGSYKLREIWEG